MKGNSEGRMEPREGGPRMLAVRGWDHEDWQQVKCYVLPPVLPALYCARQSGEKDWAGKHGRPNWHLLSIWLCASHLLSQATKRTGDLWGLSFSSFPLYFTLQLLHPLLGPCTLHNMPHFSISSQAVNLCDYLSIKSVFEAINWIKPTSGIFSFPSFPPSFLKTASYYLLALQALEFATLILPLSFWTSEV